MLNLNLLQEVQEAHMPDRCTIQHVTSSGYNTFGEVITQVVMVSGVVCGLEMTGGTTQYHGQYFSTPVDAVLRLPVETEIYPNDRVVITLHRQQEAHEAFEVVSYPQKGNTAMRIYLRRVIS
ncbi:hypothetical protein ATHL_01991 [Anaerolinea thermolimosa]|uniref:hypothetical protein n=1 Tax=Anaerolinea thermolimosa TaxID=229919 RepID=UPI000784D5A2|nr:hypothetical protein [Anaerolinea thermolimosa]GAP07123.1 hypothetical protein ATHL_01991 [Anaerolinea thermolimosa]